MGSSSNSNVHHIIPFNTLLKTGIALFGLTLLTMIAFWSNQHLGVLAAPIAFLIAGVKAVLVMMFFMGLKYDSVMNRIIFATGFFFLFVLWLISYGDIFTRVLERSTL